MHLAKTPKRQWPSCYSLQTALTWHHQPPLQSDHKILFRKIHTGACGVFPQNAQEKRPTKLIKTSFGCTNWGTEKRGWLVEGQNHGRTKEGTTQSWSIWHWQMCPGEESFCWFVLLVNTKGNVLNTVCLWGGRRPKKKVREITVCLEMGASVLQLFLGHLIMSCVLWGHGMDRDGIAEVEKSGPHEHLMVKQSTVKSGSICSLQRKNN